MHVFARLINSLFQLCVQSFMFYNHYQCSISGMTYFSFWSSPQHRFALWKSVFCILLSRWNSLVCIWLLCSICYLQIISKSAASYSLVLLLQTLPFGNFQHCPKCSCVCFIINSPYFISLGTTIFSWCSIGIPIHNPFIFLARTLVYSNSPFLVSCDSWNLVCVCVPLRLCRGGMWFSLFWLSYLFKYQFANSMTELK